ncbi:MAG TPA: hypothetical protein VF611_06920 [Pyrinomonadaceae bacterium]|jgi:hypothetical protein
MPGVFETRRKGIITPSALRQSEKVSVTGSETASPVASVSCPSGRKVFAEMYCATGLPFSGVKTTAQASSPTTFVVFPISAVLKSVSQLSGA